MQNTHLVTSLTLAVLSLSACAATGQQSPLPGGANVALGQRAYINGPIVQPVEVLEDSRCPVNVMCAWAGRLRLKMLWIRPGGREQPFEVTLGKRTPLADGSILLKQVSPKRHTEKTIKPDDYRFTFRFDGGL